VLLEGASIQKHIPVNTLDSCTGFVCFRSAQKVEICPFWTAGRLVLSHNLEAMGQTPLAIIPTQASPKQNGPLGVVSSFQRFARVPRGPPAGVWCPPFCRHKLSPEASAALCSSRKLATIFSRQQFIGLKNAEGHANTEIQLGVLTFVDASIACCHCTHQRHAKGAFRMQVRKDIFLVGA
jgi:hypothetical protein